MARRFSTGLRDALLSGRFSFTGTTISFTDSTKTIAESGGTGFLGLIPGDIILVSGAAQSGNNRYFTVVTASTAGANITVSETPTTESASNSITVALANSRGFKDIFKDGIIEIYTGTQPATADAAETGTKLLRITVASGAFTPGTATNGIEYEASPTSGVLEKASEVWSGVGLADGVAGWFRFYTNLYQTGLSTTAIRWDGSVGVSGAQLTLSSTTIVTGQTVTIDTHQMSLSS